jgi:hypothetical protein
MWRAFLLVFFLRLYFSWWFGLLVIRWVTIVCTVIVLAVLAFVLCREGKRTIVEKLFAGGSCSVFQ